MYTRLTNLSCEEGGQVEVGRGGGGGLGRSGDVDVMDLIAGGHGEALALRAHYSSLLFREVVYL